MSDNDTGNELEDVLDDDLDEGGDDDSQSDEDSGSGGSAQDDPKDKRIADLMSNWQKEQARANALEAKLKKPADGATGAGGNADVQQWIDLMRSQARDQVYASDPRFAAYEIDQSSIDGDTPEAMRASARRLSALIDGMETRMQARLLKKHGLSPEVASAPAGKAKNFATMSDEDFEKELARAKNSV